MRLKTTKEFTNGSQKSMVSEPICGTIKWPDRLAVSVEKLGSEGVASGFDDGPPPGKRWHFYINMSVVETDDPSFYAGDCEDGETEEASG